MHAYSKRFLQLLLMGIQMVTYMIDACLPELKFLAEQSYKNSKISLMGPNSHKSKVNTKTGAKN